jgi:hypothetical protein
MEWVRVRVNVKILVSDTFQLDGSIFTFNDPGTAETVSPVKAQAINAEFLSNTETEIDSDSLLLSGFLIKVK